MCLYLDMYLLLMLSVLRFLAIFQFYNAEGRLVEEGVRSSEYQDLSESLAIPALGRTFTLGALYNARTDKLVSAGVSLWDSGTLQKNLLREHHPNSLVKFMAGNSFEQRASLFDISAELKASFCCGLVKVRGAAKYLRQTMTSNHVAEVSFLYRSTTHFEQLNMDHLASDKIEHPSVLDTEKEATHVVTKIVYGANAVLSFNKEVQKSSEVKKIHGELEAAVKLVAASISGRAEVILSEEEKTNYSRFSVRFAGDLKLEKPPTTFFNAIETCKLLPSLINESTAVPTEVFLYPLSKLDRKNSRLVRSISAHLLRKVEKRIDSYEKILGNIGDLKKSLTYQKLHLFRDHIDEFQSALGVHMVQFQRHLLGVLPKVRGCGLEEIELTNVLDEGKSSFTMNKLKKWTISKKREDKTLKHILSMDSSIYKTEPGSFDELLSDFNIPFIVALKLKLYSNSDPYTKCLANQCNTSITHSSWLTNKLRTTMRKISAQYYWIKHRNVEFLPNSNTAFTIFEDVMDDTVPDVSIQIFEDGEEAESDFKVPKITSIVQQECAQTDISWTTTEKNTEKWLQKTVILASKLATEEDYTVHRIKATNFTYRQNATPTTTASTTTTTTTIPLTTTTTAAVPICDSNPCQNGGMCKEGSGSFTCHCVNGYHGNLCQHNACTSSPCKHGGTCVVGGGNRGYKCNCKRRLQGANCERRCLDVKLAYQRITLNVVTGLMEQANVKCQHLVATNRDLFFIQKMKTGTRSTEIHVLSAASNYKKFVLHTGTCLHETGDNFEFLLASNRDLVAIKKSGTGTKQTEVHIISASSGYKRFILQKTTPIPDSTADDHFAIAPNRDIMKITRHAHNGVVHIYVLTARSNYKKFSMHAARTPITIRGTSSNPWRFTMAPTCFGEGLISITEMTLFMELPQDRDLVAVLMRHTGTCMTEIHMVSAAANYGSYNLETGTALEETDNNWEFMMATNYDLFCVKLRGTASKKTELVVISKH